MVSRAGCSSLRRAPALAATVSSLRRRVAALRISETGSTRSGLLLPEFAKYVRRVISIPAAARLLCIDSGHSGAGSGVASISSSMEERQPSTHRGASFRKNLLHSASARSVCLDCSGVRSRGTGRDASSYALTLLLVLVNENRHSRAAELSMQTRT